MPKAHMKKRQHRVWIFFVYSRPENSTPKNQVQFSRLSKFSASGTLQDTRASCLGKGRSFYRPFGQSAFYHCGFLLRAGQLSTRHLVHTHTEEHADALRRKLAVCTEFNNTGANSSLPTTQIWGPEGLQYPKYKMLLGARARAFRKSLLELPPRASRIPLFWGFMRGPPLDLLSGTNMDILHVS